MRKKIFLIIAAMGLTIMALNAQTYSIVIKGGHVIDPKNNIDAEIDVAVKDGKIALVAKSIDARQGLQVVDATGLYVTPGLIDIHSHNFLWYRA
jgi:dihydroorotase